MAQKQPQRPSIWQKRVLIPFWVVRICIMIFVLASFAWTLRNLNNVKDVIKPATAVVVVFMLFIVIVLLIDILAIVMFMRDALKPGAFLTMNIFQTTFWGGVLVMDIVNLGKGGSAAGVGFSVFVFVTFLGLLIYSIVAYNKAKNIAMRGNYAPAHNPAAPAVAAYPPQYQQNTAYHSQTNGGVPMQSQYIPPYQAGAAGDFYSQQPVKPAHMV